MTLLQFLSACCRRRRVVLFCGNAGTVGVTAILARVLVGDGAWELKIEDYRLLPRQTDASDSLLLVGGRQKETDTFSSFCMARMYRFPLIPLW